ncbi:unnamed protein product [Protopolystoma xenopodis]|uniref:Uncharacterized protein n=1 Tax=Protopolystoma xenopodis TaxID=117903 RepID=A0A3S5AR51_9PLAT|nr:unnamed protein product [Protopolystoma xenopodis]
MRLNKHVEPTHYNNSLVKSHNSVHKCEILLSPFLFFLILLSASLSALPLLSWSSVADLPGLVEGAAENNRGLGAEFLSLVEGCPILAYVIDIGSQAAYLEAEFMALLPTDKAPFSPR